MLHRQAMESNQTDFLKTMEKMISVKGEAENVALGPFSMEEKNHQSASRSTNVSCRAGSEIRQNLNSVGQASLKSSRPNGSEPGVKGASSEPQEIILDANFFMNGQHGGNGREPGAKKAIDSSGPDVPKTPRSSLRKVLALLDGLTANSGNDVDGGTRAHCSSSSFTRSSVGPSAANSATSSRAASRRQLENGHASTASSAAPIDVTTPRMSSTLPSFNHVGLPITASLPHRLLSQSFGHDNGGNSDSINSRNRTGRNLFNASCSSSASSSSSTSFSSPHSPNMHVRNDASVLQSTPNRRSTKDFNDSNIMNGSNNLSSMNEVINDINGGCHESSLMDAGNSPPSSYLYDGGEFCGGGVDFIRSSSGGGLIGWRSLLGGERDSWGHPSHFSPPSIHIRYKNARGDGPSSGCFINEFESCRRKEQEKKLARHFEEKWEEICRKAEFHPKAKHRHSPNVAPDSHRNFLSIIPTNTEVAAEEQTTSRGSSVPVDLPCSPSSPQESCSTPTTSSSNSRIVLTSSTNAFKAYLPLSGIRPIQTPPPFPLHQTTPPTSPLPFEPSPFANPLLFSLLRTRPFYLTLLVAGESGLGKSTLIDSLFLTDIFAADETPKHKGDDGGKTLQLRENKVEIQERGIRLRLTMIDTPGFGDAINNDKTYRQLCDLIDSRFQEYQSNEQRKEQWETSMSEGKERSESEDGRIHCCLYFIRPGSEGLRSLDVQVLRGLQNKVNIIPVIGKADTLTKEELMAAKAKVRASLKKFDINVFEIPPCDPMEDLDILLENESMRKTWPLAVCGANSVFTISPEGRRVRGRRYPWGIVDIENPDHCDFVRLRSLLVSQLENLKQMTHRRFYAAFKAGFRTNDKHDLIKSLDVLSKSGSMPNLKFS